jgi:hypothetical protein
MKAVQVYKDNLREHIFRTMFFSDTVIFLGFGILLAISIMVFYRLGLNITDLGFTAATIFIGEILYAIVATLKIDKQPLYKIIPRGITYAVNKKQFTHNEVKKTTGDFRIIGNYIVRKKKLIAVFEIKPFDIALLNDEERERYYAHIKTMLHTLPDKIQLISRKEKATVADYHQHFFSLYNTAHKKLNPIIEQYVKDLSTVIDINEFQIMKYYAVFSTPLHAQNDLAFAQAAQRLTDMGTRFSGSLALEKIHTVQLTHKQLVTYFKEQFRNSL